MANQNTSLTALSPIARSNFTQSKLLLRPRQLVATHNPVALHALLSEQNRPIESRFHQCEFRLELLNEPHNSDTVCNRFSSLSNVV